MEFYRIVAIMTGVDFKGAGVGVAVGVSFV